MKLGLAGQRPQDQGRHRTAGVQGMAVAEHLAGEDGQAHHGTRCGRERRGRRAPGPEGAARSHGRRAVAAGPRPAARPAIAGGRAGRRPPDGARRPPRASAGGHRSSARSPARSRSGPSRSSRAVRRSTRIGIPGGPGRGGRDGCAASLRQPRQPQEVGHRPASPPRSPPARSTVPRGTAQALHPVPGRPPRAGGVRTAKETEELLRSLLAHSGSSRSRRPDQTKRTAATPSRAGSR